MIGTYGRPKMIIALHRLLWWLLTIWFAAIGLAGLLFPPLKPSLLYAGPLLLILATVVRAVVLLVHFQKSGDGSNRNLSLALLLLLALTVGIGYIL